MKFKFHKDMIRSAILFAVLVGVFNIIAFVIPFEHTGLFWLAYCFGMGSLIVCAAIFFLSFGIDPPAKSWFYGMAIARIGYLYAIIQVILSFITMAIAFTDAPVWPFAILFILLLAAVILATVINDTAREKILRQDDRLKQNSAKINELRNLGATLASQCTEPAAKAELTKLAEALRFADPISSEATAGNEAQIDNILSVIRGSIASGDAASIVPLCRQATTLLEERNRLCKLNKPF